MATLLNTHTNIRVLLRSNHIFGRHSGSSQTILENPEASRLHASILWNGTFWLLKDTSSNGTFLNNQAIPSGISKRLVKGDNIRFGSKDACVWEFVDDSPPKSMLVPLEEGGEPIELENMLVLPNSAAPEITLYTAQNGGWMCESQADLVHLETGMKVSTNNNSWYFVSGENFDSTKQLSDKSNHVLSSTVIKFSVSKNEEHVSMRINFKNNSIDLGERTHHYLMLFLARKRLSDIQLGLETSEQGWVDKDLLCQQIGLDEKYINIQIYRFRKQLIQTMPAAMQLLQIIERRRGELRFAFKSIEIKGGNDLMKLE